jgi:hypothetical protein
MSAIRPVCTIPAPHPGISLLLKTKVQPQFDRTVTDRSKPLFALTLASNHVASSLAAALVRLSQVPNTSYRLRLSNRYLSIFQVFFNEYNTLLYRKRKSKVKKKPNRASRTGRDLLLVLFRLNANCYVLTNC